MRKGSSTEHLVPDGTVRKPFQDTFNRHGNLNEYRAPEKPPVPTVMVIDDDEGFVRQISRFIESFCGLSVIDTAQSAEEALGRVADRRPSFILLDICMSGISGLDAIGPLKADSPSSQVIVVSSMPAEYGVKAAELGAHGYVEKRRVIEDLPVSLRRRPSRTRGEGRSIHDTGSFSRS